MTDFLIKINQDTVIKKSPVDSSQLANKDKLSIKAGTEIKAKFYSLTDNRHIGIEYNNNGMWYLFMDHVSILSDTLISLEQFSNIFYRANRTKINRFFMPLDMAMREFDINNINRIAMFLAQIAHESGSLQWEEEIASGSAYEGRKDLGNVNDGDGKRYKGRGLIQLTGRANYRSVGKALNLPLEDKPRYALYPYNSARIAAYFWQSRGLNQIADQNTLAAFKLVTKRINGGFNGLSDRIHYWDKAKKALMFR